MGGAAVGGGAVGGGAALGGGAKGGGGETTCPRDQPAGSLTSRATGKSAHSSPSGTEPAVPSRAPVSGLSQPAAPSGSRTWPSHASGDSPESNRARVNRGATSTAADLRCQRA